MSPTLETESLIYCRHERNSFDVGDDFHKNLSAMTTVTRVENNHYFLDTMVGYGYRPFKKPYGWLWFGYITILTIITEITVLTIITIITIITINGYHG